MHREISDISIGIPVALPVECAAVLELLDNQAEIPTPDGIYHIGAFPSAVGDHPHRVVVALQDQDGTRNAAATATRLIHDFPAVRCLVMPGIAAGVPTLWSTPVRLGDIVVATGGVVDYGHLRVEDGRSSLRRHPEGVSAGLLRADRRIQIQEHRGTYPWRDALTAGRIPARFARPDGAGEMPRVHRGTIGSGDLLLRSAAVRDSIVSDHGVAAFEMEGAGLAAAAHSAGLHWFMVRGVADFADAAKGYDWHPYASLTAAAYLRGLLAECPPLTPPGTAATASPLSRLDAVVNALLDLPEMLDGNGRRAILRALPPPIQQSVPENVVGRLHVLELVQTCLRFPGGADALLSALRLATGQTPELARVEASLRACEGS